MDKENVLEIVEDFKKELVKNGINIDRVILYGSHAKKSQRDDSDINLVVISDSFEGMDYWERIDILSEAISEVFQPIEAFAMTNQEWDNKSYIAVEYAKDGIEI